MELVYSGVIVLGLLTLCYLVAAPLFLSPKEQISFHDTTVAITVGALLAALSFSLALRIEFSNALWTIVILAGVGIFNIRRFGSTLIPVGKRKRGGYWLLYWGSFVPFGGAIFVAQVKMGLGDYPQVFFGLDTPLKLADAFQLSRSSTYPPSSLMMDGWAPAYHYGAQAAVGLISKVSRLDAHKVMFFVVAPLFTVAAHALCFQIVVKKFGVSKLSLIGLLLFVPGFLLGPYLWSIATSAAPVYELVHLLFGSPVRTTYQSAAFGNGIWDVSVLSGMVLILLAAKINLKGYEKRIWAYLFLIPPLAVFAKMDMVPAIYCLLATAVLANRKTISNIRMFMGVAIIGALGMLTLFILGYFDAESHVGMIKIKSFAEIHSRFDWRWNGGHSTLQQLYLVLIMGAVGLLYVLKMGDRPSKMGHLLSKLGKLALGGSVGGAVFIVLFGDPTNGYGFALFVGAPLVLVVVVEVIQFYSLSDSGPNDDAGRLIIGGLAVTTICMSMITFIDIAGVGGQFFLATWIAIPLVGVGLLRQTGNRLGQKLLGSLLLVPIIAVSAVAQWGKVEHLTVVMKFPKNTEEYAEVDPLLADALRYVPVKDTVVVTNGFGFGGWSDTNRAITALFGHQAYGVDLRHLPDQAGYNIEGGRRIDLQRSLFGSMASFSNEEHSRKTRALAEQEGWSHLLMKKGVQEADTATNANGLPFAKLFENDRYAVYGFATVGVEKSSSVD